MSLLFQISLSFCVFLDLGNEHPRMHEKMSLQSLLGKILKFSSLSLSIIWMVIYYSSKGKRKRVEILYKREIIVQHSINLVRWFSNINTHTHTHVCGKENFSFLFFNSYLSFGLNLKLKKAAVIDGLVEMGRGREKKCTSMVIKEWNE